MFTDQVFEVGTGRRRRREGVATGCWERPARPRRRHASSGPLSAGGILPACPHVKNGPSQMGRLHLELSTHATIVSIAAVHRTA